MKCPNCGIDTSGPFCSGCGTRIDEEQSVPASTPPTKTKKPSKTVGCLTAIITGVVVFALLMSLGDDGSSTPTTSTGTKPSASEPVEQQKPALELIEHSSEASQYSRYVIGTVKNNSSKEYGYVQVEINLYDDSGNQVGSTMDNTNNLEAGGTWKFKAIMLEDSATQYKIKDVTGF